MFGILAGISIFSASVRIQVAQELARIEQAQRDRTREDAQSLAKAVETAIMTETSATYSNTIDLNRLRAVSTEATGLTVGGQNAVVSNIVSGTSSRVMIGTTDDTLVRNAITGIATQDGMSTSNLNQRDDVMTVDTAGLRNEQLMRSKATMEAEASILYQRWSQVRDFPANQASYLATINNLSGLRDFWGQNFTYTRTDANNCTLSFTAPWGQTVTINLTMAP